MSAKAYPLHQRLLGAAIRAARRRAGLKRKESRVDRMARTQAGLKHRDAPSVVGVCLRALDGHERGETAQPLERYATAYGITVRALLRAASEIDLEPKAKGPKGPVHADPVELLQSERLTAYQIGPDSVVTFDER